MARLGLPAHWLRLAARTRLPHTWRVYAIPEVWAVRSRSCGVRRRWQYLEDRATTASELAKWARGRSHGAPQGSDGTDWRAWRGDSLRRRSAQLCGRRGLAVSPGKRFLLSHGADAAGGDAGARAGGGQDPRDGVSAALQSGAGELDGAHAHARRSTEDFGHRGRV